MKHLALVALACSALLVSCGKEVDDVKKGMDAVNQMSEAAEKMEDAQSEAKKVYEARKAKGDTIAKPYKELQAMLPTAIPGFKPEGEPAGSQQSMNGISYSNASQVWVSDNGDGRRMTVTANDWGGTEGAYGMASLAFAMNFESEDNNQKVAKMKLDAPMTNGIVTYTKANHDVNAVAGTQYRYVLMVQLNGAKDDQTAMVNDVMQSFAKNFDGK